MPDLVPPRVAVVGAGDIGCGWAALAASRGWIVTIYDTDTGKLAQSKNNITQRSMALVAMGHADVATHQIGVTELRIGRSLLQAVTDADWIIESTTEDLNSKQRVLEQVEQVCRLKAVLTSSTLNLLPSDLCGRLRRPDRMLVLHALNPVELLPAVEIVPSGLSDSACVEDVRFWLTALGRVPIILKKEIDGSVIGRITAAVWRECIHLVLEGVVDVVDVDTAMEMGPALAWAAGGPHLTSQLGSPQREAGMLSKLISANTARWEKLASWQHLSPEDQHRLARAIDKAYGAQLPQLRAARDIRLARLLNALSEEEVPSEEIR
jgi:3-hydroxybutyryl-CoA dehydrogenase